MTLEVKIFRTVTAGGAGNGAAQNPYAFHAGIKDAGSGLIKFGQHWYNPTTDTSTQQDTPDNPLDPANANRYAYAGDDPINGNDPSGASLTCDILNGALSLRLSPRAVLVRISCTPLQLMYSHRLPRIREPLLPRLLQSVYSAH